MTDNRVALRAGVISPPTGTSVPQNVPDITIPRHTSGSAILRHMTKAATLVTGTAVLMTGLLLAGCANDHGGPAGSRLRVYAADLAGAAKTCDVPKVNPAAGASTEAPMKLVNDGGWCGLHLHQDGPKPFDAGLLTTRPSHGNVLIHEVGDETRIDYTPDRGFSGSDNFAVKLVPGNAVILVPVIVTLTPPKA
jgi:hypothetical protein